MSEMPVEQLSQKQTIKAQSRLWAERIVHLGKPIKGFPFKEGYPSDFKAEYYLLLDSGRLITGQVKEALHFRLVGEGMYWQTSEGPFYEAAIAAWCRKT
jgi:hypothetical protein